MPTALTTTAPPDVGDLLREFSGIVSSLEEPQRLLDALVHLVTRTMGVDRCSLMLVDSRNDELRIRAAHHLSPEVIRHYRARPGEGIAGWVALHGKPLLIENLEGTDFASGGSGGQYRNKSLLSVPLFYGKSVIGVLNVNNRLDGGVFTKSDEALLTAVANFVVTVIERAKLREVAEEKRRIDADLALAQETQDAFIPRELPSAEDLEIVAFRRSVSKVTGDFHDALPLEHVHSCLVLGDVCGKGIASGLYMARVMGYFRAAADLHDTPDGLLASVNRLVAGERAALAFVTACLAVVDRKREHVSVYNAGHLPPYLFNEKTGTLRVIKAERGYPLGVDADSLYNHDAVALAGGDNLVFYTDGITEARNGAGEMFGEDRLVEAIISHTGPAADMVSRILDAVGQFSGGRPQADDQTLLVIRKP